MKNGFVRSSALLFIPPYQIYLYPPHTTCINPGSPGIKKGSHLHVSVVVCLSALCFGSGSRVCPVRG